MDPIQLQLAIQQMLATNPGMTREQAMGVIQGDSASLLEVTSGFDLSGGAPSSGSDIAPTATTELTPIPLGTEDTESVEGHTPSSKDKRFEELIEGGMSSKDAHSEAYPEQTVSPQLDAGGNPLALGESPYLNMGGFSLSTQAAKIGGFLGAEAGTKGKGLGLASSISGFALGATREILSGLGAAKASNYANDYIKENQQRRVYTPASQTADANYTGGNLYQDGGTHNYLKQYFPDGGTAGKHVNIEALRRKDFEHGSVSITDSNTFNLLTESADLEEYFSKFPSERRSVTEQGLRVWQRPNSDFYFKSEFGDKPAAKSVGRMPEATSPPSEPVMRDANTGAALPGAALAPGQSVDRQFSQYLEQAANSPERLASKAAVNNQRDENSQLIKAMSDEDLAEARELGLTPIAYLKSKQGSNYNELFNQ